MGFDFSLTDREVQCLIQVLNCLLHQLERNIDTKEIEAAVLRDVLGKLLRSEPPALG